jgi:RimJ/RimL family protein N-acetyltransferase
MGMVVNSGNKLKYYCSRLREEHASRGTKGLGSLILSNFARRILRTNAAIWFRLDLNEYAPATQEENSLSPGFMDLDEARSFFKDNHDSFPWMFVEEEMEMAQAAGHVFPCLRDGDVVIGYVKLGFEKVFVTDFERVLFIPSTAALIYDTFIAPSHRGKGLGSLVIGLAADFAHKNEFHDLWCHVPAWNVASQKMVERVGLKAVGEVRFIKLLGKDFFRKRPTTLPLSLGRAGKKSDELRLSEAPVQ